MSRGAAPELTPNSPYKFSVKDLVSFGSEGVNGRFFADTREKLSVSTKVVAHHALNLRKENLADTVLTEAPMPRVS
jgi:hypothetical protein